MMRVSWRMSNCFESYLEPALLPAPLTLEGVSVCTWNWGNTIDGKIIFPCHIWYWIRCNWNVLWDGNYWWQKACPKQVPRGKNQEASSYSTWSSGLSEVARMEWKVAGPWGILVDFCLDRNYLLMWVETFQSSNWGTTFNSFIELEAEAFGVVIYVGYRLYHLRVIQKDLLCIHQIPLEM